MVEEITVFLECGGGILGRDHQCWGVVLSAAVLTLAAFFFLDIPAIRLGAAVDLGSGFWGLAFSLVAVTIGCTGASVTG